MAATIRNNFDALVLRIKQYKKDQKSLYNQLLDDNSAPVATSIVLKAKYEAACRILDMASDLTEDNVYHPDTDERL